nr:hypothetical protein Itr_chr12CG19540 [Ipomoea trifida]
MNMRDVTHTEPNIESLVFCFGILLGTFPFHCFKIISFSLFVILFQAAATHSP